jgi:hypothetical protein
VTLPSEFSYGPAQDGILATGPFHVDLVIDGDAYVDLGFDLSQADDKGVTWRSFDREHSVVPAGDVTIANSTIAFADANGDTFAISPLSLGDGALVGAEPAQPSPAPDDLVSAVRALGATIYSAYRSGSDDGTLAPSENNLYLTRDAAGQPVALVKMSASHPTLLRQDNGWRPLRDDEDDLLGENDVPVKEDAVTAWDAGDIPRLERLLMDDRFSPADVTNVWLEVGNADELERLLIERSRGRIYERTDSGEWAPAQTDPDAATLDVTWGAVGAWDDGDLRRLWQAQGYDVNGDAAA